jgi:hypothetical protein
VGRSTHRYEQQRTPRKQPLNPPTQTDNSIAITSHN